MRVFMAFMSFLLLFEFQRDLLTIFFYQCFAQFTSNKTSTKQLKTLLCLMSLLTTAAAQVQVMRIVVVKCFVYIWLKKFSLSSLQGM